MKAGFLFILLFIFNFVDVLADKTDTYLIKIPGLDFLGWGYNAQLRVPEYSLTQSMFYYSYNGDGTSEFIYRFPTQVTDFAVPDQVSVKTISKLSTESYYFANSDEQIFSLGLQVGISGTTPTLSGSLTVALGLVTDDETDKTIVRNTAESALWQLKLTNKTLLPIVNEWIQNLTGTSYQQNKKNYDTFIATFGSHYVDTVVVGGLAKMDTVIEDESDSLRLTIAVTIAGKMSGAETISGKIEFDFGLLTTSTSSTSTSNSAVLGGDTYCSGWVAASNEPDVARQLFAAWKRGLAANPAVVRYRLVSVDSLFPASNQADACSAISNWLGATGFCTDNVVDLTLD